MSDITNETIDINRFFDDVLAKVQEGMSYRDAIQLSAVIMGGEIAHLVSQADGKFQEATFSQTELFHQKNVDECALASMGKLWHGEDYEGSTEQMEASQQDTILDSLYFILKYATAENPLEEALVANENVCGDKVARAALIKRAFNG